MFKKFLSVFLSALLLLTAFTGNVFALGDDVDIAVNEDGGKVPENTALVDSFEHLAEGSVKVDITKSTEFFTKSGDNYNPFNTAPAPSGDKWGMFTNFAYPTHQLVDGEYVATDAVYKNGTYCGDTYFPINAIKGAYLHTYHTDYKTDPALLSTVTVTPRTGETMIGMGQASRTNIKAIENLKPYTDYTLSVWVYQTNSSGYIKSLAVADNYDGLKSTSITPFKDGCNVLGGVVYTDKDIVYGEWTELKTEFTTNEKTTVYMHVSQVALTIDGKKAMVFLDDLSVTEMVKESETDDNFTIFEDFEAYAAGDAKVAISNNTEGLYMYNESKGTYTILPTGPAPSGNKWGMFTNFTYPTHKLVDGNYVAIEGAYKKGAYCGDNYFPIKVIKGPYQHTYYTDYKTDTSLTSTVTVTPYSGNTMIGMGQMYRTGIKALENLKPYTDYELSIWVYQTNNSGYIKSAVVADNYDGVQTNGLVAYSDDCAILGATNYYDSSFEYGKWEELSVKFSTTDKTTAYLHLSQNGLTTDGNRGMIFLDDLSVIESANKYITVRDLVEEKIVTTQGVVDVSGNYAVLEYSAAGMEFTANCEGSVKLAVVCNVYNKDWDLRLALHINGERQEDVVLTKETTEVVLAYGLEKGNYTFKLEKMGEAQIGRIFISSISIVGEFKTPPAARETYIDFYGDSITAGWGTTSYSGNYTNPYQFMDGSVTYAAVAAEKLGANFSAFGYSGWGVVVTGASDGKGEKNMTTIYPDLPKNTNADYVVVNLGTNDASKYSKAGYTWQQVKDAYLAYARNLRKDYGADTPIIFVTGMMTDAADEFSAYAVDTLRAEGDKNIYMVKLPKGTSGGVGHPDAAQQAAAGEVLANFIKSLGATLAGDINGDGEVNLTDVVALAQYVAGWDVEVNEEVKDANGDGSADLSDVVTLAQYVAGWSDINLNGTVYETYNPVSHNLKEIESKLKLNSRAAFDGDQLRMEWSYSGFEIQGQFSGDITLTNVTVSKEILCCAVVDGDTDNPIQLRVKNGNNILVKDLEPGFHTVQLIKASEAAAGQMTVGGITYNGAIFPRPADKELKIQVIGDSITSASGLYTAEVEPDALLRNDITKGYAYKVANHFDADLSIVSVSGGSVCTKNPYMQQHYQNTYYSKSGAYDFSTENEPDLVIIALGTNDTPTYNTNGVPNDNVGVLKQGIKDMLALVRAKNPNATILWAYGMMATNIASVYKEAVLEFAATDGNTYYTMINRNDCTGSGGHPTPNGHSLNAQEYIKFIENNIWND